MKKRMKAAMDKSVKTGPVRLPKKLVKEIRNAELDRERLIQERFQSKKNLSNTRVKETITAIHIEENNECESPRFEKNDTEPEPQN